jgi:hypothetical protein
MVLEPRRGGSFLSVHRHQSVLRRWWHVTHETSPIPQANPPAPIVQLQLFVESYAPLTAADRDRARMLYFQGFESLRPKGSAERGAGDREDRVAFEPQRALFPERPSSLFTR